MDDFVTLYDILEIKKDALPEEIKAAYHAMAKKYHPDVSSDTNRKEFEEKFKKINEAYTTLSDDKQRKEYDKKLKDLEKEHLEKLILDTQNQISQLKDKLYQYQEELRQKQTFPFLHKNIKDEEEADTKEKTRNPETEKTAADSCAQDSGFNSTYVPPIKLKKQIFDIIKNQSLSILKQIFAAAVFVAAVYTAIHYYFSDLPPQTKNIILTGCIISSAFIGFQAFLTVFAVLHTILIIIHKSDKGLSFVKTNNVVYCINKAISIKNSLIILLLSAITLYTLVNLIDNISNIDKFGSESIITRGIKLYSDNVLSVTIYLSVLLCCIYIYAVISIEMAKYTCPHCRSAFSYFYNKTYYTEDGHHYEYNVYYRDYLKNEVTQCEVCGYQTILSFRQKERIINRQ